MVSKLAELFLLATRAIAAREDAMAIASMVKPNT